MSHKIIETTTHDYNPVNKYIDEIDINPIIILEDKAIAVDNVFILKKIKMNLLS